MSSTPKAVLCRREIKAEQAGGSSTPSGPAGRDSRTATSYKDALERELQLQRMLLMNKRSVPPAVSGDKATPPNTVEQCPKPSPPSEPRTWTKRPAIGPPPGFAGVRHPPQKQHQPSPPQQRPHSAAQPPPTMHHAPSTSRRPALNTKKPPPHPRSTNLQPPAALPDAAKNSSGGAQLPGIPRPAAPSGRRPVRCSVCSVPCMSAFHLRQHQLGRRHRNRVAKLAGEKKTNLWCDLCNVPLSCELNVKQHNVGKQHLQQLSYRANGAAPWEQT